MGNHLTKCWCCDQELDQGRRHETLKPEQREKLQEIFHHIISNAPVDFNNEETQDIQSAMHTMLERIRTRVNSRYIIDIARIQPTGSMAERTSLWKYGLRRNLYLEFDFLAFFTKIYLY